MNVVSKYLLDKNFVYFYKFPHFANVTTVETFIENVMKH